MVEYLTVAVMLALGIIIPVSAFVVAWILAPRVPEPMKDEIYECGIEAEGEVRQRLSLRFYLIAVLFVVFDVETIFMFPWAVRYKVLGLFGLVEMALFIGILVLGYFYVWKKGALEWA